LEALRQGPNSGLGILRKQMNQSPHSSSPLFVELGLAVVGLAILARVANRFGFSAIPLYLLAGLAFGRGGIAPLELSEEFIKVGAEMGVLLLLFMLGLEYTCDELKHNLKSGLSAGTADFLLNFPPGVLVGLFLGWKPLPSMLLGGVTYISSSGVIAKVLAELGRLSNAETPSILSVLVLEDLAMAVYLPVVSVLIVGTSRMEMARSVAVAVAVVALILFVAIRFGNPVSRFAEHASDEVILLTVFGTVLLVAGIAERFNVSAAIGAFLVGIAASGAIAKQSERLLGPLRDLFAAMFFFFFGIQIDPASLPKEIPLAIGLGVITALTKVATGYWAARNTAPDRRGRLRAGMALVPRGEFSIVIAGLGTAIEPQLGPLSAAYVLFLAVAGPVLAKLA
jgi:CPA2 family monovalent cation:H+ antiporter-2